MRAPYFRLAAIAAVVAIAFACAIPRPGDSQQTQTEPTLRQRLVFGLEARRPSELAFIDAVVDSVERGDLPLTLVNRTFFWARQRPPSRYRTRLHRPIIYFQPALRMQAERLRIEIRANRPRGASGS